MKTTVRFRTGGESFARLEHNRRDPEWTKHEKHINPNGEAIIIKDQDIEEAYQEIFGEAIEKYNKKQKRKDRKIDGVKGYMEQIKNDRSGKVNRQTGERGKQLIFEVLVGVGSMKTERDQNGNLLRDGDGNILRPYSIPEEIAKEVLLEYAGTFMIDNPQLHITGMYYHADEEGSPHLHINFIPFATGYKRGLEVQNSLSKALELQGFKSRSIRESGVVQWQEAERKKLMEALKERQIQVVRPDVGKNKESEHWKIYKRKKKLEEEIDTLERTLKDQKVLDFVKEDEDFFNSLFYVSKQNERFKEIKRKELTEKIDEDMMIMMRNKYNYTK